MTYHCVIFHAEISQVVKVLHHIWQWPSCISHIVNTMAAVVMVTHDDVIKWKHFPCYWPFVWWIHRSPVNSPHKGQWGGALMFSLICAWIKSWVNNPETVDSRHHHAHYDVIVMTRNENISSHDLELQCTAVVTWSIFPEIPMKDTP